MIRGDCRKVRYESAARALAHHEKKAPGTYRRAYRCDACGWWHITTTPIGLTRVGRSAIKR